MGRDGQTERQRLKGAINNISTIPYLRTRLDKCGRPVRMSKVTSRTKGVVRDQEEDTVRVVTRYTVELIHDGSSCFTFDLFNCSDSF